MSLAVPAVSAMRYSADCTRSARSCAASRASSSAIRLRAAANAAESFLGLTWRVSRDAARARDGMPPGYCDERHAAGRGGDILHASATRVESAGRPTKQRRPGRRRQDDCWWRWGRIELPVQDTFPENFLQAFPANLAFRVAGPRPAGCFACYPVMPLGSLTPLTGVGDAAPPLMTPSPSGEVRRRRCSLLFRQRGRNYRCQLQAIARCFTRPAGASACDSRLTGPVET